MTKEEIKDQIDLDITNKTTRNSVTPILVGTNIKNVVDLLPDLIMSYEGVFNTTTTPIFKDNVINIYKVNENFTYNTVNLKINNVIGLTPTELIIIADNYKELTQSQLDAINNSSSPTSSNPFITQSVLNAYVKKINTTLLPDINGNVVIPDASETQTGLVTSSGTQNFKGKKIFKMLGNTSSPSSNVTFDFIITDLDGVEAFKVSQNRDATFLGLLKVNGNMHITNSQIQLYVAGNTTGVIKQTNSLIEIGQNTAQDKRIKIDIDTGNVTVGANSGVTTTQKLEIFSIVNGTIPYPIMTNTQRLDSGFVPKIGCGVYVSDVGVNEGIWIYKSTGWVKLI